MDDSLNKKMSKYQAKIEGLMSERRKKLKNGPNVIHLTYLSQHISQDELEELESKVASQNLQLSSLDKSGIPSASLTNASADLLLILTEPGIVGILTSGLLTNVLYDSLKSLIIACWQKIERKQTVRMTSDTVTQSPAKFHLVVKLDNKRTIELKTENLDNKSLSNAIDKISDLAVNMKSEGHQLLTFDNSLGKWNPVDLTIDFLNNRKKIPELSL